MPTEVFSISGAGLGQMAPCPVGWGTTPKGNCGAPMQGCPQNMLYPNPKNPTACRSQVAADLQAALRALGNATGDATLKALPIDGFVGPKTTAAANRAFGPQGLLPSGVGASYLRTGTLSQAQVANMAALMANIAAGQAAKLGATVPAHVFKVGAVPAAAAPEAKPEPKAAVPPPAGVEAQPRSLWYLVGLSALAAGAGAYMGWRESRPPKAEAKVYRMPTRRAA